MSWLDWALICLLTFLAVGFLCASISSAAQTIVYELRSLKETHKGFERSSDDPIIALRGMAETMRRWHEDWARRG